MFTAARFSACLLCAVLLPLPQIFAQQTSAAPRKVFTPQQKAFQQQYNAWEANYRSLQAQAKQIYDAEMAREQASEPAGDCPDAHTEANIDVCVGQLLKVTDAALASYEQIIRGLQAPQPKMPDESQPATGPLTLPTPQQYLAQFNRVEQSWRQYRKIACKAASDQFYGGSGLASSGPNVNSSSLATTFANST
ncbi:MAG TPA: lysozyme inhibitor LprI family protein [Candidatus Acidoferrales bacterium]